RRIGRATSPLAQLPQSRYTRRLGVDKSLSRLQCSAGRPLPAYRAGRFFFRYPERAARLNLADPASRNHPAEWRGAFPGGLTSVKRLLRMPVTVIAASASLSLSGCGRVIIYCEGEPAKSPDGECNAQLVQDVATHGAYAVVECNDWQYEPYPDWTAVILE